MQPTLPILPMNFSIFVLLSIMHLCSCRYPVLFAMLLIHIEWDTQAADDFLPADTACPYFQSMVHESH